MRSKKAYAPAALNLGMEALEPARSMTRNSRRYHHHSPEGGPSGAKRHASTPLTTADVTERPNH